MTDPVNITAEKKNQSPDVSPTRSLYSEGLSATELLPTGCPRWPRSLEAAEPAFVKKEMGQANVRSGGSMAQGRVPLGTMDPFPHGLSPCEACLPLSLSPSSSACLRSSSTKDWHLSCLLCFQGLL